MNTTANTESNFWVCDIGHHFPSHNPDLTNWFGVVDEEAGGIFAYFLSEEDALNFISTLAPAHAGE